MNSLLNTSWMIIAIITGAIAFGCTVFLLLRRNDRAKRRSGLLMAKISKEEVKRGTSKYKGIYEQILHYCIRLTRQIFARSVTPLTPCVRKQQAEKSKSGIWYTKHALVSGYSKEISLSAFCEARTRLGLMGLAGGSVIGAIFSTELCLLLAILCGLYGYMLPAIAVKQAAKKRTQGAEVHLSEMLEITALGLRSGLSFDLAFALYGKYFKNEFAQSCTKAYKSWSLGLTSREEALQELANSYNYPQLTRIVDSILRSLRFGTALANILEESSKQARLSYRSALEERVAKAPVKMMLPTGTLILPAMLLLVIGPVLLELAGGF